MVGEAGGGALHRIYRTGQACLHECAAWARRGHGILWYSKDLRAAHARPSKERLDSEFARSEWLQNKHDLDTRTAQSGHARIENRHRRGALIPQYKNNRQLSITARALEWALVGPRHGLPVRHQSSQARKVLDRCWPARWT